MRSNGVAYRPRGAHHRHMRGRRRDARHAGQFRRDLGAGAGAQRFREQHKLIAERAARHQARDGGGLERRCRITAFVPVLPRR